MGWWSSESNLLSALKIETFSSKGLYAASLPCFFGEIGSVLFHVPRGVKANPSELVAHAQQSKVREKDFQSRHDRLLLLSSANVPLLARLVLTWTKVVGFCPQQSNPAVLMHSRSVRRLLCEHRCSNLKIRINIQRTSWKTYLLTGDTNVIDCTSISRAEVERLTVGAKCFFRFATVRKWWTETVPKEIVLFARSA